MRILGWVCLFWYKVGLADLKCWWICLGYGGLFWNLFVLGLFLFSCLFRLGVWYFGLFGLVLLGLVGFDGLSLGCGVWVVVRQFRDFGNLIIFWSGRIW